MTKENIIKLYDHFTFLSKGKFVSSDFNQDNEDEDKGRHLYGRFSADRKKLIMSNALKALAELETKYPFLKEKPKTEKVKKSEDIKE